MNESQKEKLKKLEKECIEYGETRKTTKRLVQLKKEEMKILNGEYTDDHTRCNICRKILLKKNLKSHNKTKLHLKNINEPNKVTFKTY